MKYNVKIYQMNVNSDILFMPYDFTMKHGGIDFENYDMVYEMCVIDNRNEYQILEDIYEMLNIDHPHDSRGRSLSVSDIVELNGNRYFVDSFGYQKI